MKSDAGGVPDPTTLTFANLRTYGWLPTDPALLLTGMGTRADKRRQRWVARQGVPAGRRPQSGPG